jgi:hypothetical protein
MNKDIVNKLLNERKNWHPYYFDGVDVPISNENKLLDSLGLGHYNCFGLFGNLIGGWLPVCRNTIDNCIYQIHHNSSEKRYYLNQSMDAFYQSLRIYTYFYDKLAEKTIGGQFVFQAMDNESVDNLVKAINKIDPSTILRESQWEVEVRFELKLKMEMSESSENKWDYHD